MKKNIAFEGYQKQAVEDILGYKLLTSTFRKARNGAEKKPASTMQHRIELIASEARFIR